MMNEQELTKASEKMSAAVMAAIEECKDVMVRHAETLELDGMRHGVVIITTCHLMAMMIEAGCDPKVMKFGKAKAISTRKSIEDIVIPSLEKLYEVTDAG